MATIGKQRKSKVKSLKQQKLDGELGLIIDEMGLAMWNADRGYIAESTFDIPLTLSMRMALYRFVAFCKQHPERTAK